MTKKEMHKEINRRFYDYLNENFTEYTIDSSEGFCFFYGRIYLIPKSGNINNAIEYHQSSHDLCCVNWSEEKTKKDVETMELFLNDILKQYSI